MRQFAVVVTDTGHLAWVGPAKSSADACGRAVKARNEPVGPFRPSDAALARHEDGIAHLTLSVYDVSNLNSNDMTNLQQGFDDRSLTLVDLVGCFTAEYDS